MIIALTGAGISKASGIPTFEEQGDLRNYLSRDYANNYPKEFKKLMLLKNSLNQFFLQ